MNSLFKLKFPLAQAEQTGSGKDLDAIRTKFEIDMLKRKISDTDYKVTKCHEYALCGLELPYDIKALHTERQALRDKINELEGGG